jgi:hypothetical protein
MDIRDRVMGDKPDSFLHKIAGIIPGFNGYMERERRRDADKLLRTYLANQYANARARLTRVQQGMVRGRNLDYIAEVDRIAGVLQRFIDRLNTATYGYTGLFDPVKIEETELDQLYAFDMALTAGVDQVSTAVSGLESAALDTASEKSEVPAALSTLAGVVDELNLRLNQRQDFISTGRGLDQTEYNSMLSSLNQPMAPVAPVAPQAPAAPVAPVAPMGEVPQSSGSAYMAPPPAAGTMGTAGVASSGAPTMPTNTPYDPNAPYNPNAPVGGDMARVQGSGGYGGNEGSGGDKPETPRATSQASSEMGRLDEMPPVDQWPSAPSPWANKEEGSAGAAGTAGTMSSDTRDLGGMPRPSAGPSGMTPTDMEARGDAGSNRPWSGNADAFGSGGGPTGGNYNSASGAGEGGIESASSPTVPGEDLADTPRVSNDAGDLDVQAMDDSFRQEDKG